MWKVRLFYTVLGQKSLSLLHRADASMIWSSYIFDKKNKWLSYNLWFMYIYFYKNIIFCQFYLKENKKYFHKQTKSFILNKNKKFYLNKSKLRFSYYIDLYCIEIFESLILINLFFFTNLRFYKQELTSQNLQEDELPFDEFFLNDNEQYTSTDISNNENLYEEFF